MSTPRILVVLPDMPQDPANGAARSTSTIAEMLAASGLEVRVLGSTATTQRNSTPDDWLRDLGVRPKIQSTKGRPEWRYEHRAVQYRLLDVGARDPLKWQEIHGSQFDLMFDDELRVFRPDLLLTYGGSAGDGRRRKRAKKQGVRVVFALHNTAYLSREFFDDIDDALTPTQFLTDFYREKVGIASTPLPLPIAPEDVIAAEREPIFVTMINPAPEKGLMLVARLCEDLSVRRPDIAVMIIESRGSAGKLVQAALLGGFDLRRHENILFSPALPRPSDIYVAARCLLAPSLLQEAAGRVAAEAMLNGVPPLVSDRGGLPEVCNGAGFVFPIPVEVTPETRMPVESQVVAPWVETIERLYDDESFYAEESERARRAALIYSADALQPRYAEYFHQIVDHSGL